MGGMFVKVAMRHAPQMYDAMYMQNMPKWSCW